MREVLKCKVRGRIVVDSVDSFVYTHAWACVTRAVVFQGVPFVLILESQAETEGWKNDLTGSAKVNSN